MNSVSPEPSEIEENDDGTITISWDYDKILIDEDNTISISVNINGEDKAWVDIFTDTYLLFYDKDGNPLLIVFERDNENRITSIIDPMGNSVKYGYDNCGDLVAVADRENNVIRFTYDENHYLKDIISAEMNMMMTETIYPIQIKEDIKHYIHIMNLDYLFRKLIKEVTLQNQIMMIRAI